MSQTVRPPDVGARTSSLASERTAIGRSIALMLLATLVLSTMHVLVRHTSAGIHPFEIAFFRNLLGLVFLLPLLLRFGISAVRSQQPWLQVLRGAVGAASMMAWFYGLSVVPLAEATTLSFIGVVFSSIFAVLFLREPMRARRWAAIGVNLIGTLVVLRPGYSDLSVGVLAVLFSAVTWGAGVVLVKHLSRVDSPICIVTWMSVTLSALSLPPALLVWTWPTLEQFFFLALIALLATLGHLAFAKALQLADATLLVPLDFLRLVWAGLAGYLLFAEVPDLWSLIGGTLIVASAIYITRRQKLTKAAPVRSDEPN